MEKYAFLLGYFDKQWNFVERLHSELIEIDLSSYEKRFVFAMRIQQLYTAIEDLLKQIAKSFENHIENASNFHKELLMRMNTEVPKIRPAILSSDSFLCLDKIRAFRHFIRHAYDCELDEGELQQICEKLKAGFPSIKQDLFHFREFIKLLA
jgi:hypothetical protein